MAYGLKSREEILAAKRPPANARVRPGLVTGEMDAEMPTDDTAEHQEKPDLQAVKDFVNGLDQVQFGYLEECVNKRKEQGMDEEEEFKTPEEVKSEMESDDANEQRTTNVDA